MNEYSAIFLFLGVTLGSAVLVFPSTVDHLGPIPFTLILFSMLTIIMFCSLMANYSFTHVINTRKRGEENNDIYRRPMRVFCNEAHGQGFSKFVVTLQLLTSIASSLSLALLAATTLQTIFPLDSFATSNQIRMWVVVTYTVLFPLSLQGSFKELGMATFAATALIVCSLICIIISSILVKSLSVEIPVITVTEYQLSIFEMVVSRIGIITYGLSGIMNVLPNLAVTVPDSQKLMFSISMASLFIYVMYMISGLVPYFLLKPYQIDASVIDTLTRISNASSSSALKIFITLSQITATLHFILASILFAYPVYLYFEESFKIPKEFNWKRVIGRLTILLFMCVICVIFPTFLPVMSWVGGVPVLLYMTVIPIIMYFRFFQAKLCFKIFYAVIACLLIAFILVINFVDLYILIAKNY